MVTDSRFKKYDLTDLCIYAFECVQECKDGGVGGGHLSWSDLDNLSTTKCLKGSGICVIGIMDLVKSEVIHCVNVFIQTE